MAARNAIGLAIALLVLFSSSSSSNEELLENSRKIPKIKNFVQVVHNLTDKVHLPFAKAMTKLKFKLHLVRQMSTSSPKWSQNELRKINIDVTSVMNFKNLREKVSTIFLLSDVSSFDIFWKDEEDTMIIITTDEELEIALKDIATKNGWNNVYDLYILVENHYSWTRSIDSMENVSCEDILPFTAKRAMGDKWMFKLHMIDTMRSWTRSEVHKINIDINDVLNLTNLYKKLQTIFPRLQGSYFDVAWKDKECEKYPGIYITIATREELALALEEMYWRARENNKNFYNLYILLRQDANVME
ncbi:uncharacterized protein LOC120358052 [Solenopsis invicta]|uniref:uncharacterized protein LOC120358052 n=1 Tax=Solenopsis invicta TaxID=13686 RepID=UPI00193D78E6|nr:uncharacterized protein LOC120358052 [Solenopsis invicta]